MVILTTIIPNNIVQIIKLKLLRSHYSTTCEYLLKMVKTRRFIVAKHFQKNPEPSDLQLIEEELPSLHNGGKDFNNRVIYVSIKQMQVDVT